jgi:hypothetical protein
MSIGFEGKRHREHKYFSTIFMAYTRRTIGIMHLIHEGQVITVLKPHVIDV